MGRPVESFTCLPREIRLFVAFVLVLPFAVNRTPRGEWFA